MNKEYRIKLESKRNGEIKHSSYYLEFAENERDARAKFWKEQHAIAKELKNDFPQSRKKYDNFRRKIVAIHELDPATITSTLEGPHLITIPVLQHLPRELVVIRPADSPACECGWERLVWRDAEGHYLSNELKGVGCRLYMEDPPIGGPWHLVETVDSSVGLYLCQKHLESTFPDWETMGRGPTRSDAAGR